MKYEVAYSRRFEKELKRLSKRYASIYDDAARLGASIEENPFQGVDLGNGVRKIRMAISSKRKGKSGGARVITLNAVVDGDGVVTLMSIYDKSERESISKEEIAWLVEENS